MRIKLLLIVLAVSMVFGFSTQAFATVYTFQPTPTDLYDLNHYYYYVWGVQWVPQPDEILVDANLTIANLNNWTNETNHLYMHLIDEAPTSLVVAYDSQTGGDSLWGWTAGNLAGPNILLDTYSDTDGSYGSINPGINYTYSFSANGTLDDLLLFANNNGDFSLGFDPDCNYYNNGITLELITRTNVIPEPASLLLFASGILGLAFRRKIA